MGNGKMTPEQLIAVADERIRELRGLLGDLNRREKEVRKLLDGTIESRLQERMNEATTAMWEEVGIILNDFGKKANESVQSFQQDYLDWMNVQKVLDKVAQQLFHQLMDEKTEQGMELIKSRRRTSPNRTHCSTETVAGQT